MSRSARSPELPSPVKDGSVVPAQVEQPSAATMFCVIANTSTREALSEEVRGEGGVRGMRGVRTEKEGAERRQPGPSIIP